MKKLSSIRSIVLNGAGVSALCLFICLSIFLYQGNVTAQQPIVVTEAVLEDFSDIVTQSDLGFNDFSGNVGASNKDGRDYGRAWLVMDSTSPPRLRFDWDFNIFPDEEAFTGVFFSIFGLTDTLGTLDGQTVSKISFPEHSLNLNDIDAPLTEPGGARSLNTVCLLVKYTGSVTLTLRLEMKDSAGGGRFERFAINASAQPQTITWNFRQNGTTTGNGDLDFTRAKVFTIVIERRNIGDNITNPLAGSLDLHRIWFTPDRQEIEPISDQDLLDLLERRACQYFFDWSSRKTTSHGIPQDRSTFGDLLTVGGIGFALPAYAIAAERGWVTRQAAAERALSVLRILSDSSSFGPETKGKIGYKGWFYHFLGVDGKRKLNFDFTDTPVNEALNTVELSTIDTGLALMGVLAAQSYFTGNDASETEIRNLAQGIYDKVDWGFMLENMSNQFYLGWKPNEQFEGAPFSIPDMEGKGNYAGVPDNPFTLDFYTDEAFIVTLLATGSTTHPVASRVHCAWFRNRDEKGLIRTFPGALFTYQFLGAFIDTRKLLIAPCPNEAKIDWYENTRKAITAAIDYAEMQPPAFQTYGPNAWGISAAEGPFGAYQAYGAPPVAVNQVPEQDGTVTYYGMMSAVSSGADLRLRVIQALRNAWQRGDWHYRFALPDAFNDEIGQATVPAGISPLRQTGSWRNRSLFAIDQGPMLLHLENARSGLVWNLLAQNPNIQRAVTRLRNELSVQKILEGEDETAVGDGQAMFRSEASGGKTVLLLTNQTRTFSFRLDQSACLGIDIRYSNDNGTMQPLEIVNVVIDGIPLGQFTAMDTGDGGAGWNVFLSSGTIGRMNMGVGNHLLTLSVTGGDGFGVEIDYVRLTEENCTPVTTVSAANFLGPEMAAESISAAFGQSLASGTQAAEGNTLPTFLIGTDIKVKDNLGTVRQSPLFFVSPTQVNLQIPPGTALGAAALIVTNGGGLSSYGTVQIVPVAPGIFTANASGQGVPAAVVIRVKADQSQTTEPVARFLPVVNQFVAIPVDPGAETDQVFLVLFGTGIRNNSGLQNVKATIGGMNAGVSYAGPQGGFVGLDQINILIPRMLAGSGQVDVLLNVDGKNANAVIINML